MPDILGKIVSFGAAAAAVVDRTVKLHKTARPSLEKSGNFAYENEQNAYT